jgi:hypothetical protein
MDGEGCVADLGVGEEGQLALLLPRHEAELHGVV